MRSLFHHCDERACHTNVIMPCNQEHIQIFPQVYRHLTMISPDTNPRHMDTNPRHIYPSHDLFVVKQ